MSAQSTNITAELETLARLLEYPAEQDYAAHSPALAALSQDEREELYTTTFDVTPACVPYVSIHLFGEENFKRGKFMAALNARYIAAGFNTYGELPDHIAVLLRFVAQIDEDERQEMIRFCLLGPLTKMIVALSAEHPYRALFENVRALFDVAYPGLQAPPSPLEQMQAHGTKCNAAVPACGGCSAAQPEHAFVP